VTRRIKQEKKKGMIVLDRQLKYKKYSPSLLKIPSMPKDMYLVPKNSEKYIEFFKHRRELINLKYRHPASPSASPP
jgi:hypothetical protein